MRYGRGKNWVFHTLGYGVVKCISSAWIVIRSYPNYISAHGLDAHGKPKKIGYCFYHSWEINKVIISHHPVLLEKECLVARVSRRKIKLEEVEVEPQVEMSIEKLVKE